MFRKQLLLRLVGFLFFPLFAHAATQSDNLDASTHPPLPLHHIAGFTLTSYMSASYNYLSRSQYFTSGVIDRVHDLDPNGFTLQEASLSIYKQPAQGFGGLLNIMMGRNTYQLAAYGMTPWFDSRNAALDFNLGYLQYALNSLTVIAGKFESLAGYESSYSIYNTEFSSSYINAFDEPSTYLGMRATYDFSPNIKLIAGVNNGWDNVRDWGRRKTLELGWSYADKTSSLAAYFYNGQERATPRTSFGPLGIRNLIDIIAIKNITDQLKLAVNYDYASQTTAALPSGELARAAWWGIAAYLQYQLNTKYHVTLRADYFNDPQGFATGIRQNLRALTFALGYLVLKNFELRAETRHDISNVNSFENKNGIGQNNNNQSFALEGILTI